MFASLTALLIGLLIGPFVIERLREFQIGQYIREEGTAEPSEEERHADDGRCADPASRLLVPTLLWSDLSNPFVWLVVTLDGGIRKRSGLHGRLHQGGA